VPRPQPFEKVWLRKVPHACWGKRGGDLEQISILAPQERVGLNHEQLQGLFEDLGEVGAEDVVCRAMEELAVRLAHAEKRYRDGERADMVHVVRSLVAIAEQVGMSTVARVAGDVCQCARQGNEVGLAATFARLVRIGERSLSAIWDLDQFGP